MQIFTDNGTHAGKLAGNPDLGQSSGGASLQAGLGPVTTSDKYTFALVTRTFCPAPCPVWGIGRYLNQYTGRFVTVIPSLMHFTHSLLAH